jgi:hypothetical protein
LSSVLTEILLAKGELDRFDARDILVVVVFRRRRTRKSYITKT